MKWLFAISALLGGACATASPDHPAGGGGPDASVGPMPDAASSPDAPPSAVQVTLQQTTDVAVGATVPNCANGLGDVAAMGWYRVFPLADHQIANKLHVEKITFGVTSSAKSPKLTIKLGTYAGALDGKNLATSMITQVAMTTLTVPDSGNALVDVPLAADVPAGSNLIIEIAQPATTTDGPLVKFGSTASAETHQGYMRAAQCNSNSATPRSLADWGSPNAHLLITVTGTKS